MRSNPRFVTWPEAAIPQPHAMMASGAPTSEDVTPHGKLFIPKGHG